MMALVLTTYSIMFTPAPRDVVGDMLNGPHLTVEQQADHVILRKVIGDRAGALA